MFDLSDNETTIILYEYHIHDILKDINPII